MRSNSKAILISEVASFGLFRAIGVVFWCLGLFAAFLEIDAIKSGGDALKPSGLWLSFHDSHAEDE
jgi:hypothetical protein